MWLLSRMPVPGTTTLLPKLVLSEAVQATQLPSASAVEKCVVWRLCSRRKKSVRRLMQTTWKIYDLS